MPILDFLTDYPREFTSRWIMCGKGPTFHPNFEIKDESVITLNEVIRETNADLAHIIDADVLKRVEDYLDINARYLVMPYFPHFTWRPNRDLDIKRVLSFGWFPVLNRMAESRRLFCYNLGTAKKIVSGKLVYSKRSESPVIFANNYSAEAAVNLLGELGAKEIKTLGIDGGHAQSTTFDDLPNINLDKGYDAQWDNIRRCIKKYNLNFGPKYLESPIRIFVGCSDAEEIPFQVLKCSIERHATMSVDVQPLSRWMSMIPPVTDKTLSARTPFSFQRFLIPELCGYKGHAIYLDSDMQVFSDIKELWSQDFKDRSLVVPRGTDTGKRKAQFSVMLMDCSKLDWRIGEITAALNDGLFSYEQIMHDMVLADYRDNACPEWNSLESYNSSTRLLHYTDFHTQPWKLAKHPLCNLWETEFREALKQGYVSKELTLAHIDKGHIRASLLSLAEQPQPPHLAATTSGNDTLGTASV